MGLLSSLLGSANKQALGLGDPIPSSPFGQQFNGLMGRLSDDINKQLAVPNLTLKKVWIDELNDFWDQTNTYEVPTDRYKVSYGYGMGVHALKNAAWNIEAKEDRYPVVPKMKKALRKGSLLHFSD